MALLTPKTESKARSLLWAPFKDLQVRYRSMIVLNMASFSS